MKKRVTIYDIASVLNIAPASVSRALNNSPNISLQTRETVHAMAREMNYQPNVMAMNLRMGESKMIGVIVPKINNQFFSTVISGLDSVFSEKKYNIIICQTDELYNKEVDSINMLIRQNVAGIIISLSETTQNTDHIKQITSQNIPLVQFDRVDESVKSIKVVNDNRSATVDTVKHLHKQGYSKIAFLGGSKNVDIFRERHDAFRQGLKETGLPYINEFVAFDCLARVNAKKFVLEILSKPDRPDAIFASADLAALGALDAAKELKIDVPGQLGICGYSNEDYTALTHPTLTTISQNSKEMGATIAELFLKYKENETQVIEPRVIKAELIIRESSLRKRDVK